MEMGDPAYDRHMAEVDIRTVDPLGSRHHHRPRLGARRRL